MVRSIFNKCKFCEKLQKLFFISPISIGSIALNCKQNNNKKTDLDIFKSFINNKEFDYIVLDLDCITIELVKIDNIYYTKNQSNIAKDPIRIINEDPNNYIKEFDAFIEIITKRFDNNHIILISSFLPYLMVSNNKINVIPTNQNNYTKPHNDTINFFESFFISKTHCIYIDIAKYYYSQCNYSDYAPFKYENTFYLAMSEILTSIIIDKSNKKYGFNIPLNYNIDRYAYYIFPTNLYLVSTPHNIFREDNLFGNIIVYSSQTFALNYKKYFIDLYNKQCQTYDDILLNLNKNAYPNDFILTLKIIIQVINEKLDINLLKIADENNFAFKNLKYKEIGKFFVKNKLVDNSHIVTMNNSIYYLYVKQLITTATENPTKVIFQKIIKDNKSDLDIIENKFNTIINPLQIDIWGACYSRVILYCSEDKITCNKYLFQVDPLTSIGNPVTYPNNIFDTDMSLDDKMVKIQLDGSAEDFLHNTSSKWLMFDFYTLLGNRQCYYNGKGFYNHPTNNTSKLTPVLNVLHYQLGHLDHIKKRLDCFIETIKSLYKDNLIYIDCRFTQYYINENNKILAFINDPLLINYKENKSYFEICKKYLLDNLNCYYVDLSNYFFAEESAFLGLSPTHFEKNMYIEEAKIIEYIMTQKPKIKKYSELNNGKMLMERYIRLIKNNPKELVLKSIPNKKICKELIELTLEQTITKKQYFIDLVNNNAIF
jgi:hypothetical protein